MHVVRIAANTLINMVTLTNEVLTHDTGEGSINSCVHGAYNRCVLYNQGRTGHRAGLSASGVGRKLAHLPATFHKCGKTVCRMEHGFENLSRTVSICLVTCSFARNICSWVIKWHRTCLSYFTSHCACRFIVQFDKNNTEFCRKTVTTTIHLPVFLILHSPQCSNVCHSSRAIGQFYWLID